MMRTFHYLACLVILGGILAGCMNPEKASGEKGLAIGKVAPEVEGQDADGLRLKLSGLRGQVVLLDFWKSS